MGIDVEGRMMWWELIRAERNDAGQGGEVGRKEDIQ